MPGEREAINHQNIPDVDMTFRATGVPVRVMVPTSTFPKEPPGALKRRAGSAAAPPGKDRWEKRRRRRNASRGGHCRTAGTGDPSREVNGGSTEGQAIVSGSEEGGVIGGDEVSTLFASLGASSTSGTNVIRSMISLVIFKKAVCSTRRRAGGRQEVRNRR